MAEKKETSLAQKIFSALEKSPARNLGDLFFQGLPLPVQDYITSKTTPAELGGEPSLLFSSPSLEEVAAARKPSEERLGEYAEENLATGLLGSTSPVAAAGIRGLRGYYRPYSYYKPYDTNLQRFKDVIQGKRGPYARTYYDMKDLKSRIDPLPKHERPFDPSYVPRETPSLELAKFRQTKIDKSTPNATRMINKRAEAAESLERTKHRKAAYDDTYEEALRILDATDAASRHKVLDPVNQAKKNLLQTNKELLQKRVSSNYEAMQKARETNNFGWYNSLRWDTENTQGELEKVEKEMRKLVYSPKGSAKAFELAFKRINREKRKRDELAAIIEENKNTISRIDKANQDFEAKKLAELNKGPEYTVPEIYRNNPALAEEYKYLVKYKNSLTDPQKNFEKMLKEFRKNPPPSEFLGKQELVKEMEEYARENYPRSFKPDEYAPPIINYEDLAPLSSLPDMRKSAPLTSLPDMRKSAPPPYTMVELEKELQSNLPTQQEIDALKEKIEQREKIRDLAKEKRKFALKAREEMGRASKPLPDYKSPDYNLDWFEKLKKRHWGERVRQAEKSAAEDLVAKPREFVEPTDYVPSLRNDGIPISRGTREEIDRFKKAQETAAKSAADTALTEKFKQRLKKLTPDLEYLQGQLDKKLITPKELAEELEYLENYAEKNPPLWNTEDLMTIYKPQIDRTVREARFNQWKRGLKQTAEGVKEKMGFSKKVGGK